MSNCQNVAIITGGGSGIGLGVTKSLLGKGYTCIVVDSNPRLNENFLPMQDGNPGNLIFLCEDLSLWNSSSRVFQVLEEKNLHATLLVNNVSPRSRAGLEETEESWDRTMDGTLKSAFTLSRIFLEKFATEKSKFGAIVNVSSVCSNLVGNQSPSYHIAKAGLESLTRYFAVNARRNQLNITVNTLSLGMIIQDRHLDKFESDDNLEYRKAISKYLMNSDRFGSESDVSNAVLFLANESQGFINGANLMIDGGASLQEQCELTFNRDSAI